MAGSLNAGVAASEVAISPRPTFIHRGPLSSPGNILTDRHRLTGRLFDRLSRPFRVPPGGVEPLSGGVQLGLSDLDRGLGDLLSGDGELHRNLKQPRGPDLTGG